MALQHQIHQFINIEKTTPYKCQAQIKGIAQIWVDFVISYALYDTV